MEAIIQLENKTDRNKVENDLLKLNRTLLDTAITNQHTASIGTFVFFFFGLGFCVYGARNWREKIQTRDDRLPQLQIEKLEAEINKLRAEVDNANRRD
jgi:hypothetical protein